MFYFRKGFNKLTSDLTKPNGLDRDRLYRKITLRIGNPRTASVTKKGKITYIGPTLKNANDTGY